MKDNGLKAYKRLPSTIREYFSHDLSVVKVDLKALNLIRNIRKSVKKANETQCTLPNGKVITGDFGYVEEFFEEIEKAYPQLKEILK